MGPVWGLHLNAESGTVPKYDPNIGLWMKSVSLRQMMLVMSFIHVQACAVTTCVNIGSTTVIFVIRMITVMILPASPSTDHWTS